MDQQAMLYDDLKQLNNLYQAAMMSKLYDTADNIVDVYIPMGITAPYVDNAIIPMYQAYVRVLGE
jgi:hypothetical protein